MFTAVFWYILVNTFFAFWGIIFVRRLKVGENTTLYLLGKALFLIFLVLITFELSFVSRLPWQFVMFTVIVVFGGILLVSAKFSLKNGKRMLQRPVFREFLKIELMGIVLFILLSLIRGMNPEIFSTEKPMDYLFIASFLKQKYIPFENPWLAGFILNYYYFGHLMGAVLLKLTNIVPYIGYNLLISLWATWTFQVVLGVLLFFWRRLTPVLRENRANSLLYRALLGSILIMFGGNLVLLWYIFCDLPVIGDMIRGLNLVKGKSGCGFYYPDSTRFMPYTIHEFPAYSIWLGDLHGHYWGMLLIVILLFLIYRWWEVLHMDSLQKNLGEIYKLAALVGVVVGALGMTNPWDVIPIAIFLIILGTAYILRGDQNLKYRFIKIVVSAIIMAGIAVLVLSPFLLTYIFPGDGLGVAYSSDWIYYIFLWGQFIFPVLLVFLYRRYRNVKKKTGLEPRAAQYLMSLFVAGIVSVLLTQFIFLKDVFYKSNPPYFRTNTIFKIYFISWFFIGIPAVEYVLRNFCDLNRLFKGVLVFLGGIMAVYSVITVYQRFYGGDLNRVKKQVFGRIFSRDYLNGLKWGQGFGYPVSLEDIVLAYQQKNIYFLENVTFESYKANVPFCTYSGGMCVLGWPLHIYQWHGGYTGAGVVYKGKELTHKFKDSAYVDVLERKRWLNILFEKEYDDICSGVRFLGPWRELLILHDRCGHVVFEEYHDVESICGRL